MGARHLALLQSGFTDRRCVQDLAYVLATSYVATSILVSGFYIRIRDMRVSIMRGLSYLSYTKYAMQGVSRLELSGRRFDDTNCPAAGELSAH